MKPTENSKENEMPLYINTNVMSLNAQNNLSNTQNSLATSLQRLSSGLRINSAADDAAGFAIAQQMTAQIDGLNQASQNANDGISMAQTAQGGLNSEISLLQSMRTLAVQAANGTNSASDRQAIQTQIAQLQQELNRTANSTQFNGLNILDGTMSNAQFQVGANAGQTINFGIASAKGGDIGNNAISSNGTMSAAVAGTASGTAPSNNVTAQNLTIMGAGTNQTVAVTAGESAINVANAVNNLSDKTGVTATATTSAELSGIASGTVSFSLSGSNSTGVTISASVTNTNDLSGIAAAINAQTATTGISAYSDQSGHLFMTQAQGYDVKVAGFSSSVSGGTASLTGANGSAATLTSGAAGDSGTVGGVVKFSSPTAYSVKSDTASTFFSSAANTVNGSSLNSVSGIDVTTLTNGSPSGANDAINTIDMALQALNTQAASLGAVQNRFQDTISNLQTTSQNLSAARSRIQDTNFAAETANLTRSQILQQAGTAMLAQANQLPNMVLSLLK